MLIALFMMISSIPDTQLFAHITCQLRAHLPDTDNVHNKTVALSFARMDQGLLPLYACINFHVYSHEGYKYCTLEQKMFYPLPVI